MVTSFFSSVANPSKPSWLYPCTSEAGRPERFATSAKESSFFRSLVDAIVRPAGTKVYAEKTKIAMDLSRLAFLSDQNVHHVFFHGLLDTSLTDYLNCFQHVPTVPLVFSDLKSHQ